MPKLKPCPFCGSHAVELEDCIVCGNEDCCTTVMSIKERTKDGRLRVLINAIDTWNARAKSGGETNAQQQPHTA